MFLLAIPNRARLMARVPFVLTLAWLGVTRPASANLLTNGEFDLGNAGFTSAYTYSSIDLSQESLYTVGNNPNSYHPQAPSFGDHTTGSGLMLLANGATAADKAVWQQSVVVQPNTLYALSGWGAAWGNDGLGHDPNPASLQWTVDDGRLRDPTTLWSSVGQWTKASATFYSGTATGVTLKLLDQNLSGYGNDFAIDDLALVPVATGPNLVQNPNFSSGNTGFDTDYAFSSSNSSEGQYTVGTDPSLFNPLGHSFGDRTTGSGQMLIVNGATQPGQTVWRQTISVQPGTDYSFSAWLASWGDSGLGSDPDAANLMLLINDVPVVPNLGLPATDALWVQMWADWNAGASTTATIRLVDLNDRRVGNDFVLDDLAFVAVPEPAAASLAGIGAASLLLPRWLRLKARRAARR